MSRRSVRWRAIDKLIRADRGTVLSTFGRKTPAVAPDGPGPILYGNTAVKQRGNTLNGLRNFGAENGSSQGWDMALTGLFVPSSLDRG